MKAKYTFPKLTQTLKNQYGFSEVWDWGLRAITTFHFFQDTIAGLLQSYFEQDDVTITFKPEEMAIEYETDNEDAFKALNEEISNFEQDDYVEEMTKDFAYAFLGTTWQMNTKNMEVAEKLYMNVFKDEE